MMLMTTESASSDPREWNWCVIKVLRFMIAAEMGADMV
jgi:hypothetical protein